MSAADVHRPPYRWSALLAGVRHLWHALPVVGPVIIGNALAQSLLILANPVGLTAFSVLVGIVSFIVLAISIVLCTAALLAVTRGGKARWPDAIATLTSRGLATTGWMLILLIAVIVGIALCVIPGLIVIAVVPFVLVAVVDGVRNPLKANFAALGRRWLRWLVTTVIIGVLAWLLWLLSFANAFFVTGAPAALIAWIGYGALAAWFLSAWVAIWVSATVAPDGVAA